MYELHVCTVRDKLFPDGSSEKDRVRMYVCSSVSLSQDFSSNNCVYVCVYEVDTLLPHVMMLALLLLQKAIMSQGGKDDSKLQATNSLSMKRLENYTRVSQTTL